MKVKITNGVVVKGFPGVQKGDVIDVPDNLASELIACNNAVKDYGIETREPEIENRDPGFSVASASEITKRPRRKSV